MTAKPIEARALAAIPAVGQLAPSPDGKHVAAVIDHDGRCQIVLLPSEGGVPRRLTADIAPASSRSWGGRNLVWSPDGRSLAFVAHNGVGSNVFTVDVESGATTRVTNYNWPDRTPRWSPDGTQIALVTEVDGRDVVSVVPAAGGWPQRVSIPDFHAAEPAWSPDGSRIAFTSNRGADQRSHNRDIVVVDISTGDEIQLTESDGNADDSPAWSPDGATIAFVSERSGWRNVFLMSASGENRRELLPEEAEQTAPAWSSDGRRIVFKRQSGMISEPRVIDVGSGGVVAIDSGLTGSAAEDIVWVAERDEIALIRLTPTQPGEVVAAPVDGSPSRPLTALSPVVADALGMVEPSTVRYRSRDGLEIEALLFTPSDVQPGEARPGLVYVHGGPTWQVERDWLPDVQHLVSHGYTVIAPNFRGSTGYGREFDRANDMDWGGGDLDDCVAAAQELRNLPWIASDRIGIWGGSYGGYMTLIAIGKHPDAFQAGVDLYGSSDEATLWMQSDAPGKRGIEQEVGLPLHRRDHYRQGAGIHFADRIKAPLLMLHGTEDARVTLQQSEAMKAELIRLNMRFEYHTYPGEAHGFRRVDNWVDVQDKIVEFLGRVL